MTCPLETTDLEDPMESTSASTPSPSVKDQLAALDTTSTADLKKLFQDYFGFAPNVGHPEFLRKQLAWKIQERAYGGYSPRALARIEELLAGMPGKRQPYQNRQRDLIEAGTRFIRKHRRSRKGRTAPSATKGDPSLSPNPLPQDDQETRK